MSEAPERIWIEDEFGEGDDDQWTYGTWDVRNYRGYDVEYVRADIVQNLTAERERLRGALLDHNDLLRSAIAIAEREGVRGEIASTNWDAYYNRAAVVLKRHHQITTDARAALKGESHE